MAFTYDIPEKFAEIPLSRSEIIIKNTLDGVKYDGPILSRLEYLFSVLNEEIISGAAAGTAIKYKGSKANIAALPTVSDTPEGYMYTLISGGTTTSDFVEGAGHAIPDGENVVAVNMGTEETPVMKWDTLGGITDGLQPLITALNKLSADLVDDSNSTNKFVTETEKQIWNGKQNAIDSSHKLPSRLVDDSSSTNKFVTATEKQTWNGKQDALTFDTAPTQGSTNPVFSMGIYTALAGKQDALSQAQLDAVNSGINRTKVEQIETNKNNILSEQAKTVGMSEGGSNYITVGGIRVYVSTTAPTGDIPDRSVGVGW